MHLVLEILRITRGNMLLLVMELIRIVKLRFEPCTM